MLDECSLFLSLSLRNVLGNISQHWHLLHCTPNDVESSIKCQGDESLAMELIISITHGRVVLSSLLIRQYECQEHYQFGSGLSGWENMFRGGDTE